MQPFVYILQTFFRDFKFNTNFYVHSLHVSKSIDLLFRKQWQCIFYANMWEILSRRDKSLGRTYAWTKRLMF